MEDKKTSIEHVVIRLRAAPDTSDTDNTEKLWYDKPASIWLEALPIGNGRLGGMIYGGRKTEQIQLNEDSFWSGGPHNNNSSSSKNVLGQVRQLIFNGQESDAENIINKEFIKGPHGMKYLSLGSLFLTHPDINDNNVRNYRRELDLKTALSTVTFEHQGVNYKRITFASIPNDIIIMRMEADRKSSFNISHKCDFNTSNENSQGGIVYKIQGVGHEGINPKLTAELLVKVIESDGMTNYSNGGVQVNNYTYATILINAATNYVNYNDVSGDASAKIKNSLINAEKSNYEQILENHLKEYQKQYNRVRLSLPSDQRNCNLTTEKRLNSFAGSEDWGMVALLFNYGRYLLISCSQPGSQPANLQGVWNDKKSAPWQIYY